MNLKAIAQILFLLTSSLVISSLALLFAFHQFHRKSCALIPINSPENSILINTPRIFIGRGSEVDVSILDESISSKHCLITQRKGRFLIKDLNSKNGTFVNGQPILESELKDGDLLTIGNKKFIFKVE
ncbi:MAG: FHA domain-containing protein [Actinobacteria bacterium]|nr:FHA domain-containing protein [Actinomycetota bacterium]